MGDPGRDTVDGATVRHPFTNRYEIKYKVPLAGFQELESRLADIFEPDRSADDGCGYFVNSIYFDSPELRFLNEKREGDLTRIKPRLRWYTRAPGDTPEQVYMELKGRHDRIVLKRRVPLDCDLARAILENPQALGNDEISSSSVLAEFAYLAGRFNLRPVVLVHYHRQPLAGRFHPRLRMTFDRLMLCGWATSLDARIEDCVPALSPTSGILELKFNDKAPWLLLRRMNAMGLVGQTFSKYATSLEELLNRMTAHCSVWRAAPSAVTIPVMDRAGPFVRPAFRDLRGG